MAGSRESQPPPDTRTGRLAFWRKAGTALDRPGHNPDTAGGQQELEILDALGDLRDMDVREVMTPRVDVVALTIPVRAEDVAKAVRESGHSGFPVVDGDLDNLIGILFVNDLFRTRPGGTDEHLPEPAPLEISRRIRQPLVVPESVGVLEALAEMRRLHRGFAVVIDEHGGVAGVLTVKDLLEPLVGELLDEFDEDEEPAFVRVDGSRWLVSGSASVDDVRERLGIEIPDGDYVTLGGYLFDAFGHIPEEGERLSVEGGTWELRIVEMDRRRIAKVVAKRIETADADAPNATLGDRPEIADPDARNGATEVHTGHEA